MAELRQVSPRLLAIFCLAATCCHGQSESQRVLELAYPAKKAELKAGVLALDESGVQAVISDIKDNGLKSGLDLSRKSFLIDVILDREEPVAAMAIGNLLNPNVDPVVVMLTVRQIAHRREPHYFSELGRLLDDERVSSTVSSPTGDHPVTVRHEVIEALRLITGARPSVAGASEGERAVAWRHWLQERQ